MRMKSGQKKGKRGEIEVKGTEGEGKIGGRSEDGSV